MRKKSRKNFRRVPVHATERQCNFCRKFSRRLLIASLSAIYDVLPFFGVASGLANRCGPMMALRYMRGAEAHGKTIGNFADPMRGVKITRGKLVLAAFSRLVWRLLQASLREFPLRAVLFSLFL